MNAPVNDTTALAHKELGQRSKAELESLFGNMYTGWDRGVVVTQERFGDGETRFSERPMTPMELAARYVAAEIGANIYEIAGRGAFAPIITFSQIQVHVGPVFEGMAAEIDRLKEELARTERNRDMWKGQCERQAEQLRANRASTAPSEEEIARAIKTKIREIPAANPAVVQFVPSTLSRVIDSSLLDRIAIEAAAAVLALLGKSPDCNGWQPIETAWKDPRVTGEQRTLFVARFGREQFPSFNTVYYDFLQGGDSHPWCFADGGGAYHRDWPTHWMFCEDAAPEPPQTSGLPRDRKDT